MRNILLEKLRQHFYNPNYLYFMISLVLLILFAPVSMMLDSVALLQWVLYGIVLYMAAIFTSRNTLELIIFLVLSTILVLIFFKGQENSTVAVVSATMNIAYFLLVLINLMRYVLQAKEVTANIIFACIAGYLVLGIFAAPLYSLINTFIAQSFSLAPDAAFYDFVYFSFITLTSIGFGDILPIHPLAKSLTLVMGIVGQLYLTFLVGIIVGKYLANEAIKRMQNENS